MEPEDQNITMERLLMEYIIPSTYRKLGDIYSCVNSSGFESKEEVMEYIDAKSESDLEKYIKDDGFEAWKDIVCESEAFDVHVINY